MVDRNKKYRIDASERPRSPDQRAIDNMPKLPSRVDWRGDAKKATEKYEKQYLRAKAAGDNTYITTPKQYAKQWQEAARLGQARETLRRAMYSPVQQANTTTNLDIKSTDPKKRETLNGLQDLVKGYELSRSLPPKKLLDQIDELENELQGGIQTQKNQNAEPTKAEDDAVVENAQGAVNNPMQTGEISYSYTPPASSNIGRFLNISGNAWDAYKKALTSLESSGGTQNVSGGSGKAYDGIYQIGEAAKINAQKMAAKNGIVLNPYDQTPKSRQAFLDNLEDQESYLEMFTIDNDRQLTALAGDKYTSLSPEEKLIVLGYAHNQGASGAAEWLKTGKGDVDGFDTPGTRFSDAVRRNLSELYAMEEVNASALRPQVAGLERPTYSPEQFDIKAPITKEPSTPIAYDEVILPNQDRNDGLRGAGTNSSPRNSSPRSSTSTPYDQVILPNQDINNAFRAAGTTSPIDEYKFVEDINASLPLPPRNSSPRPRSTLGQLISQLPDSPRNSSPGSTFGQNLRLLPKGYSSKETDANGNPIIENAFLPDELRAVGLLKPEQEAKAKQLEKVLRKRDNGEYEYTRDDNIRFRGFDKFGALAFDQFTPGTGEAPEITNETLRNYELTGVNSAKSPITPEQQAALGNAYAATEAMMPRNRAAGRSALRDPFTAERGRLDAAYKREKADIIKNNKYPSILLEDLDRKYQSFYSDLEANRRQAATNAIAAEETAYQRNRDAKTDQIAEQERRMGNLERRMEGVVDTINRNGKKRRGKDWPGYSYAEMYAFANPAEIAALDLNTEQDLINQLPAWFGLAKAVEDKSNDIVTFNDLLKENSDLVGNTRGLFDRLISLNFDNLEVTVKGKDYIISKEDFMQYYSR